MIKKKNFANKTKTKNFLKLISNNLLPGDVVFLNGSFGVGKTFSASIIISELAGTKFISSPTFNLVKTYPVKDNLEIWHCDFYRLVDSNELEEIGVFENINQKIILIEWPKFDKMYNLNPLIIDIEFGKKLNERNFYFNLSQEWRNRINFVN